MNMTKIKTIPKENCKKRKPQTNIPHEYSYRIFNKMLTSYICYVYNNYINIYIMAK